MIDFTKEISFKTARSGGKGGQNVNKVETMVEASWHIDSSACFSPEEKKLLQEKLNNKINKQGFLIVKSSATRSQLENKEIAVKKMQEMIAKNLIKQKKRIATKVSKAAKEKRLFSKRQDSLLKQLRKKNKFSDD